MKSIKRRFNGNKEKNPFWSSYIIFAHSIRYQQFSKDRIARGFNELVETDDYQKKDKKALLGIKNLMKLTNEVRHT